MRKKIALSGVQGLVHALEVSAIPLGIPWPWLGKREHIPDGCVPLDGALSLRSEFEDFWGMVEAGVFECHDDADWIATPSLRGGFSFGDAATTFRWPDLNGKQADSFKGAYLRGDGRSDMQVGDMHGDAIRNITGYMPSAVSVLANQDPIGGAFYTDGIDYDTGEWSAGTDGGAHFFDASRVVPTTDPLTGENRGVGAVVCWIMKVRGGTVAELSPTAPATLGSNNFTGAQHFSGGFTVGESAVVDTASALKTVSGAGAQELSLEEQLQIRTNIGGKANCKSELILLSGGAVDLVGLPEWVTEVKVDIYDYLQSTNTFSLFRVIDAANQVHASNYVCATSGLGASSMSSTDNTTALPLYKNTTDKMSVSINMRRVKGLGWLLNAQGQYTPVGGILSRGIFTVDTALSGIRITCASGAITSGYMQMEYS